MALAPWAEGTSPSKGGWGERKEGAVSSLEKQYKVEKGELTFNF